ncbi:MAG: pentapeptide repeat-containing protein [Chloroflexota bacterium]|nr:pentapeptide repeat-containing protein [Chloroflexota bacterium]
MANQEQLDLLAQGVEAWNQWKTDTRETAPAPKWNLSYDADLSDADLSGVNLDGVNLGKVDLSGANCAGTHLVGACLAEAELAEANFTGATLTGADLSGANVCATNFTNADLRNADLRWANAWTANFTNADLRNADLREADLSDARLQGANLSGAHLSRDDLRELHRQGANLSGANFSGVHSSAYLLESYFHRAQIREAKEAGAVMQPLNTDHQEAKRGIRFFLKKPTLSQGQDIIFYTRANIRLLYLIGVSLLFVIGGVWLLQKPENPVQMVIIISVVVLSGLGGVILLLLFLRQLFSHTPLLIINEEGIQYFYPFLLEAVEKNQMTHGNITLKWQEIGALGLIIEQTNSFAVYASARRWRSGWSPSLRLPQSLLPIPVKQLIVLIHEHYQVQIETYGIENVEIAD